MNIGSIGRDFAHNSVRRIMFESSQTIFEFDSVFVDCRDLFPNGLNPNVINFRKGEFLDFLALGRTIVVFTVPFQLEIIFPVPSMNLRPISGKRVRFEGPDHLKAFCDAVNPDMQYLTHFEKSVGQSFLFVPDTSKAVASLIKVQRGYILLLPWMDWNFQYPSAFTESSARFIGAFEKLNEYLAPKKPRMELPAWSTHYGWQQERELRNNLNSFEKQKDDIAKLIEKTSKELDVEDKLKILFTAKGDVLVNAIIEVFRSLGVKADGGDPGRDDISIEFDGKPVVAEVKGKKKSGAEEDAAQLEKWVAGFKAEKGVDPKGILLINAYCETPLAERSEPPFPHQMLKYSTQREHCLITTLQLLGLFLEARAHPEKRPELRVSKLTPHF